MNVEDHEIKSENYCDIDCFCLKRFFCSPNRVEPSKPDKGTVGREKSQPFTVYFSPLEIRGGTSNMERKRDLRSRTPAKIQVLSPPKTPIVGAMHQSRSSQALVSPGEAENTYRPLTRVMNRHPSADEIANLPHISPNKTQSDVNLSSRSKERNTGLSLGGRVVLPPLPIPRKGAEGDAAKPITFKAKSMFKRRNELEKRGDDGSGEQVITFSLPKLSAEPVEIRNQNQVVRKGGMAYDIIIPSAKAPLPLIQKRHFVQSSSNNLECRLEPEKNLKQKLEKAERRRLARQEEIRRQRRQRSEQINQIRVGQLDQANDKARHLEAKLEKAAEKRKEQLTNRQAASRKRLERVRRQRRTSEGSFDQIETENMTQEDIWKFLVTRGNDEDSKDVPWWEKNQTGKDRERETEESERTNSKIPRYKHN